MQWSHVGVYKIMFFLTLIIPKEIESNYLRIFSHIYCAKQKHMFTAWWGLRLIKKNVPPKRTKFLTTYVYEVLVGKDRLWAAMFLLAEATHLTAPVVLVTL